MPIHTLFFLILHLPPRSTLFPYTTLFRSGTEDRVPGHRRGGAIRLLLSRRGRVERGERHRGPTRRLAHRRRQDRKSTRLNSSHRTISYAVFCLKKKKEYCR